MGGECGTKGEGRETRVEFWLGNVKRLLGRRRSKWEENITMDRQETKWARQVDLSAPGLGQFQA
jgi:hypothetical protein